jgi:FkbM family methyltransferase
MSKLDQYQNVVVYGANSINTKKSYEYLKRLGKNIIAFSDGDDMLWKKEVYGVACIAPDALPIENAIVVVASGVSAPDISHFLSERNVEFVYIGEELYRNETDKLRLFKSYLSDEESLNIFDVLIKAKTALHYDDIAKISRNPRDQYFDIFSYGTGGGTNMTFVDCGAFVGETIEEFMFYEKSAAKIYAFEPVKSCYNALSNRCDRIAGEWAIDRANIICVNAAVGARSGKAGFANISGESTATIITDGDNVNVVSLDEYLAGVRADFIKMDIEGSELDALRGAKDIITKHKPKLAICIYHTLWDFYEIPLYIKSLVPKYKLALRHYSNDTRETVLYAWV